MPFEIESVDVPPQIVPGSEISVDVIVTNVKRIERDMQPGSGSCPEPMVRGGIKVAFAGASATDGECFGQGDSLPLRASFIAPERPGEYTIHIIAFATGPGSPSDRKEVTVQVT